MALTKVQADGINVADDFAFTGTVSGAGLASPFPEATNVTVGSVVNNIATGLAVAYAYWSDTATVEKSLNIASCTDNGAGSWTLNIANDMDSATFVAAGHNKRKFAGNLLAMTACSGLAAGTASFLCELPNASHQQTETGFEMVTIHGDLA
jgi:hypothetical protein